jgi:heat shock protein HslJ
MARTLVMAVTVALLLAAPAAAEAASPLKGTDWTFKRVGGRAMPAKHPVQLHFQALEFGGDDDCNRFGGRYRSGTERLRFGDIVSTAVACDFGPPARPDWTRALIRTRFYRLTGGQLLLLGKRGRTLARLAPRV